MAKSDPLVRGRYYYRPESSTAVWQCSDYGEEDGQTVALMQLLPLRPTNEAVPVPLPPPEDAHAWVRWDGMTTNDGRIAIGSPGVVIPITVDVLREFVAEGYITRHGQFTDAALQYMLEQMDLTHVLGSPVLASNSDDKPDAINPSHYQRGGMESIDVIEAFGLGFDTGNAVKYTLRAGHKEPSGDQTWLDKEIEDMEKAEWYVKRRLANLRARRESGDVR